LLPLPGVCGLEGVKQSIAEVLLWPRMYAHLFRELAPGLVPESGLLLFGPPGK
jgi:SpoVK/Ycf46/Vps4 family AAA+-type ATPase